MSKKIKSRKRIKKIHNLYKECKMIFEVAPVICGEIAEIENEDEKLFYANLSDFFLQLEQSKII